jgi:hypothetical protein
MAELKFGKGKSLAEEQRGEFGLVHGGRELERGSVERTEQG